MEKNQHKKITKAERKKDGEAAFKVATLKAAKDLKVKPKTRVLPSKPRTPLTKPISAQMFFFKEVIPKLKSASDKKFEMSAAESSRRVVQMWNSLSTEER